MAYKNVEAIRLSKSYLNETFKNYQKIAKGIKKNSAVRYVKNIRKPLMAERNLHIMEINKQSPYKQINIMDKYVAETKDNDDAPKPKDGHKSQSGIGKPKKIDDKLSNKSKVITTPKGSIKSKSGSEIEKINNVKSEKT
jgi:hypothetical protein